MEFPDSIIIYNQIHRFLRIYNAMCQFFVKSGAKLRYRLSDKTCYHILQNAMHKGSQGSWLRPKETFALVQSQAGELGKLTSSQWNKLVQLAGAWACVGGHDYVDLIVEIFQKVYKPNAAMVLSPWILSGGSHEEIQRLMDYGASINAFGGGQISLSPARYSPRIFVQKDLPNIRLWKQL